MELKNELNELQNQVNSFNQEKINWEEQANLIKTTAVQKKELELKDQMSDLQLKIKELQSQLQQTESKHKELVLNETSAIKEEKDKKINELKEQITDLEKANLQFKVIQNKTKGENFEHEVEGELRKVFVDDVIEKITNQVQKADYLQTVKENDMICGKIVYEVKNAQWQKGWEKKLVEDMASREAKYGILVATSFNDQYRGIPFKVSDFSPNIYLTDPDSFTFVGHILRNMIKVENRINEKYKNKDISDKLQEFHKWRESTFQRVNKVFAEQFEKIESSEASILSKVETIKKAREKIRSDWTSLIKSFIEGLNI
ncbi:hypothetical protein SCLARK_001767 [Spiroplasma clarkii]|nr:DUF2130 domain-containing protein [Spiroplasma clarkii]ARU92220.1 hypothetical protein SCLARK_001767 [Spiroplasma clarkii]